MIRLEYSKDGHSFDVANYFSEISKLADWVKHTDRCYDYTFPVNNIYSAEVVEITCLKLHRQFSYIGTDGKDCDQDTFYSVFSRPIHELDLMRAQLEDPANSKS